MAEEYTTLLEFDMKSGGTVTQTIRKSFEGIRTPSAYYPEDLLSLGSIVRAIGPFAQGYSVGNCSSSLANRDLEMSMLEAGNRFIGRDQRLKFGKIADGLAAMRQVFTGRVLDYSSANGVTTFDVRDIGADRFSKPIRSFAKSLNSSVFGDLPAGRPELIVPIIYGDISTNGGNMTGAGPVPCYLIDTDAGGKWRYVVAQHVCKSVDTVYKYGVVQASGFTVTTASYDGKTMQVIDFDADPRDAARPNETEITVLVKGITDDGLATGNLLTNPERQKKHFLENYAGWTSSELDTSLFNAAIAASDDNELGGASAPYKTCLVINGDLELRVIDVLNKMTESWLSYTWITAANKVGTFLLTLAEAASDPVPAFSVTDGIDILERSFSTRGNSGGVYSRIDFQRVYNWTLGVYAVKAAQNISIPIRRSAPLPHPFRTAPKPSPYRTAPLPYDKGATAVLELGDEDTPDAPARLISMEYVADENTAISVASVYGKLADGRVRFASFDLPPSYILNTAADLNRYVGVTHWQGIAADGLGYRNAAFRIVRTETFLQPRDKKLRITAMRLPP